MVKQCPNCGAENRDLARFCQKCRHPLEIICPSCGTVNGSQSNFCSICGYAFPGGSQPLSTGGHPGARMPAAPVGLPPGTILDRRYRIEKRIGGGGMGSVYQATDTRLGNSWAIKEMSDSALTDPSERQQAIQAFENEARLLARLNHPNLPKVNNHFEENGRYYLVMDFIDGQTLEAIIDSKIAASSGGAKGALFSEAQVLKWAEELCDVLTYLHSQNPPVIFRDLKPGNIMIEKNGRIRLIDFGVARLFKPGKSKDTASFGTKGFAPPEQYGKGQTDARSDVYALGATLHFLLTMHDPSDDPFHFAPAADLNPVVSQKTSDALARAVSFERADRWPTMVAFASALKEAAAQPVKKAVSVAPVFTPASVSAQTAAPVKQPKTFASGPAARNISLTSNTCPQCGTYLTNLDVRCPNCGTARTSTTTNAQDGSLTAINLCRACGTFMSNIDTRCPNCGAPRQSKPAAGSYTQPSPSNNYPRAAETPVGRIWLGWISTAFSVFFFASGIDSWFLAFLAEVVVLVISLSLLTNRSRTANQHGKYMLVINFLIFIMMVLIAST